MMEGILLALVLGLIAGMVAGVYVVGKLVNPAASTMIPAAPASGRPALAEAMGLPQWYISSLGAMGLGSA